MKIIEVSPEAVLWAYLERAKYNQRMAFVYSWKRWRFYNSLRLARAHKYLDIIQKYLYCEREISCRQVSKIMGKGVRISAKPVSAGFVEHYNRLIREIFGLEHFKQHWLWYGQIGRDLDFSSEPDRGEIPF